MSTPPDQRSLLLLICAVLALMLNGCAHVSVRNGAGVEIFKTSANMRNVAFRQGDTSLTADVIDPAATIRAQGAFVGTAASGAAAVITSTFIPTGL